MRWPTSIAFRPTLRGNESNACSISTAAVSTSRTLAVSRRSPTGSGTRRKLYSLTLASRSARCAFCHSMPLLDLEKVNIHTFFAQIEKLALAAYETGMTLLRSSPSREPAQSSEESLTQCNKASLEWLQLALELLERQGDGATLTLQVRATATLQGSCSRSHADSGQPGRSAQSPRACSADRDTSALAVATSRRSPASSSGASDSIT